MKHSKNNRDNINKALPKRVGLEWASSIYFIGIGGIGMSALAHYFLANNKQVSGYDKTPSAITDGLENLGVSICFEDQVSKINAEFLDPSTTLVIYTPAIPETHQQFNYFKANGFTVQKRSQVLGQITKQTFCLAVAGTHGKTTTTSILGHLLYESGVALTGFLGGISENYNSNLILKGTEVTVVEADEFDRSFLTLSPNFACITSMDADHLDIYGNEDELIKTFRDFSNCIKPNGKLFVKNGLPLQGITYGIEDASDYAAVNIKITNGSYLFDLKTPKGQLQKFQFSLPGRHNLSNAVVALAMALEYGCDATLLKNALQSYRGVKRRFSYAIKKDDFILIDDYAHHPEEINAVHQAVSEMYPNQSVLAIFQPHLYSRTKDFADAFAESLSKFNHIALLDIYPAREQPIEGVTSKWLLDNINNPNKSNIKKTQIVKTIKATKAQIVLMIGAGDIGEEVKKVTQILNHEA